MSRKRTRSYITGKGHAFFEHVPIYAEYTKNAPPQISEATSERLQKNLAPVGDNSAAAISARKLLDAFGY